jgi:hypothetical protein
MVEEICPLKGESPIANKEALYLRTRSYKLALKTSEEEK